MVVVTCVCHPSMFYVNCSLSILLKLDFWRNPHQNQEYSKDGKIQEWLEIGDLVSNDEIVATAAENPSINTVWFMYVIEVKCVDHSSNNTGDIGHNVPKSQPYLLCNYLEKLNDNKKDVEYQRSKKTFSFKLVSANFYLSPNDNPSKNMKNVFHFI